jgi:cobalt-zinc-cadmium efflux system protein
MAPGRHRRPLAIVRGISSTIVVVEVIGAPVSGSLALLADAGRLPTDVAGLGLASITAMFAGRPCSDARARGHGRPGVLAAAAQAAVLLAVGGFVLVEGVRRLFDPPAVASGVMVVFGLVAMAGTGISIQLLSRISGGNLTTRAALLEVIHRARGAVTVLIAAGVIAFTGRARPAAVALVLIGVMIVPRTWTLLRETLDVVMRATPTDVDLVAVRAHILDVPHVRDVHDLHASSVASDLPVPTSHVVVDDANFHDGHLPTLLDKLQECLAGHFDVKHSTFQLEPTAHGAHEHAVHV